MKEIFMPVTGENCEISNLGRLRRRGRTFIPGGNNPKVRYTQFKIHNHKTKQTHVAVWDAFNGPVPEGFEVNHIDKNTHNNRLDNLNLMTHEQNVQYSVCKPILQYDKNGNFIREYSSMTEAGKELGLNSPGNIGSCLTGKRKSAYNFVWKYKE